MYIMIYHVLMIHSSRAKNAAFADLAAAVAAHRMHAVVAICERHVACEQLPGIANRQWYSVERYTSQALPSAAKRAIGLLSTRCDGYDAAFAGLAAAVAAHARGCRHVRASRCMRDSNAGH